MRMFARKPKTAQQNGHAIATMAGPTPSAQGEKLHTILELQRAIGNRAVQRLSLGRALTRTGRSGLRLQRSPLSDSVNAAWTADPTLEALLARLSRPDVQGNQADTDVDALIRRLLTGRPDDLWIAERIRRGELGRTTGALGPRGPSGAPVPRPVQAFFFRGATARRALVIAGVHGTERQGIEVARLLINDLQTRQPQFTVIVVPSLFPDNAARGPFGERESGSTPTNRNFPLPTEDLAAARAAGRGTAVDASVSGGRRRRAILPENLMLLELLERFQPERIISIHGTRRPGAAGVFYDPRALSPAEIQAARDWAAERAARQTPPRSVQFAEGGEEAWRSELRDISFRQRVQELLSQAADTDRTLSLTAARQIDAATARITGRESRSFGREGERAAVTTAEAPGRRAHPSIGGNVGPSGTIENASWSGSGTGGVSLGEYAAPRGMSVFTVEPPVNRNIGDYPTTLDAGVDQAERRVELQSYADAVRTVLLGAP
ncbi:MAG: hypothetical protein ACM30E_05210 [Nitrososphaerales archaeon]